MRKFNWILGLACLLPFDLSHAAAPLGATSDRPGLVVDWQGWARDARARFTPATAADVEAANAQVRDRVGRLQRALHERPDGVIWSREIRLPELVEQLSLDPPQADRVDAALLPLRQRFPTSLQPDVRELSEALSELRACLLRSDPAAAQRFAESIQVIAAALREAERNVPADERAGVAELRSAYAYLVRVAQLADLLERPRAVLSAPNEVMFASQSYLAEVGRREFRVPLDWRTTSQGATLSGQGELRLRTHVAVVPNEQRGQIEVGVDGDGDAAVHVRRRKVSVAATLTACVAGRQTILLGSEGVEGLPIHVTLSSRTGIRSVDVGRPGSWGDRLLEGAVRRLVTRQLAAQKESATRQAEREVEQRATDEAFDIAYRINGLFERLYWQRLVRREIQPRLRIRSSPEGVIWSAEYARPWELGAPGDPPLVEDLPSEDLQWWLHESALNNRADALAGVRLDEATFFALLSEDLKLTSREWSHLVEPRVPAAIFLARQRPVEIHFGERQFTVTLRLDAFEYEGQRYPLNTQLVQVAYDLVPLGDAWTLQRSQPFQLTPASFPDQESLARTLERFLPASAEPAPRFRNESFGSTLELTRIQIHKGWLGFGARRVVEPTMRSSNGQSAEERQGMRQVAEAIP